MIGRWVVVVDWIRNWLVDFVLEGNVVGRFVISVGYVVNKWGDLFGYGRGNCIVVIFGFWLIKWDLKIGIVSIIIDIWINFSVYFEFIVFDKVNS